MTSNNIPRLMDHQRRLSDPIKFVVKVPVPRGARSRRVHHDASIDAIDDGENIAPRSLT